MKILIDGDACNKIKQIEKFAKKNNIPCHLYCDTSHVLTSEISTVHIIDKAPDAVDFAIINNTVKDDIVITSDTGLAAMCLAKHATVLNPKGFEYTNANIMSYLTKRHIRKSIKKKTGHGKVNGLPRYNTPLQSLTKLLYTVLDRTGN